MIARKYFGQHFLHDVNTMRKIVESARIEPTDRVLEIGPGRGALTELLLEKAASLTAIEIDHALCAKLRERFAQPMKDNRFSLIDADVMRIDPDSWSSHEVMVANLPYNITTPFLIRLTTKPTSFRTVALMLQRDAVDRLMAKVGSRDWGYVNFRLAYRFTVEFAMAISRGVFIPPPHVDSAVIRLTPRQHEGVPREDLLFRLVDAAFRQRRRMLRQALKPVLSESVLSALTTAQPDLLSRRGETLDEADWLALHRAVVDLDRP
jgi:16S rRNA (adenine1518-N6/adenine1519-N6)-dimethyltransferase